MHSIFAYLVALPALIVWGLGLPIILFWGLTKNRAAIINNDDKQIKLLLEFIYGGFKSDYYFWEIGISLRKIIIISIVVFVTSYGVLA